MLNVKKAPRHGKLSLIKLISGIIIVMSLSALLLSCVGKQLLVTNQTPESPTNTSELTMPALTATSSSQTDSPSVTPSATVSPSNPQLLPDLIIRPPKVLRIMVNDKTGKREFRFETAVINDGDGPLELERKGEGTQGEFPVMQRIMMTDGTQEEKLAGYFVFRDSHNHWHFENFTEVQLYSVKPDGSPDRLIATTNKISFCIVDMERVTPPLANSPETSVYTGCNNEKQGISVGWVDIYNEDIDGQQLNINDLPDGIYIVQTLVDPDNLLLEKDEDNNFSIIYTEITGTEIKIIEAPASGAPTAQISEPD